ncbi:armadillo-type protein [Pyronema domesticum]|uniref:Eukaryotic translation initiation factor 3 subunit K n=1 Tax=Pyronema omphalodes (strain CBS 100304) TaxID=1076935 RepID=U4LIB2_PYROM|nr:armadillo-type protein [Pyronema domesticum]CCX16454.1 Similar to Eukaryotic translation initiation factor 3 subunit K; acc. no. A6SDU6 [Pyronema omphalodes CBS 100304]
MTTQPIPAGSRPEHIDAYLSGLDRYNPETVSTFQDYVQLQCENQTYDAMSNLALLKLYQFNPHLTRDETITNILVKALLVFPSPDFSLCLHLLPPNVLDANTATDDLSAAVRKLCVLNELIESASYREFWTAYESDDLYADLVADCAGFEETMRDAIALQISMIAREVKKDFVQGSLNVNDDNLTPLLQRYGWTVEGDMIKIPINKENEAKTMVFRESVAFNQFQGVVRRGFEQAA